MDYQCKYVVVRKEERTEVMGRGKSGRRAVISKDEDGRAESRCCYSGGTRQRSVTDWDVTGTDDT